MLAPTRVALVGGGFAGRSIWGPRLAAVANAKIVAVVDSAPDIRNYWQSILGPRSVFGDLYDLPANTIDLAFILTPATLHLDHATWFLQQGTSVVIEKPICINVDEVDALIGAVKGAAVCIPSRVNVFRSDVRRFIDLATSCGEIRHCEAAWIRGRGMPPMDNWRNGFFSDGGGVLLDLGWHLADVAVEVLGDVKPIRAVATRSADFMASNARADWIEGTPASAPEVSPTGAEDTFRGFAVTSNGSSLSLSAAWASHCTLDETRFHVDGTRGRVALRTTFGFSPHRLTGSRITLERSGHETIVEHFDSPIGVEYDEFLRHALDLVSGGHTGPESEVAADSAHNLCLIRSVAAIIEAMHEGAELVTLFPGNPVEEKCHQDF